MKKLFSSFAVMAAIGLMTTACSQEGDTVIDPPRLADASQKNVSSMETKVVSKADALDIATMFNANTSIDHTYYIEYLNSVKEYTNYGITLITNPGVCGHTSHNDFHMNWGWGDSPKNGWYIYPTPSNSNYSYDRMDILVRL